MSRTALPGKPDSAQGDVIQQINRQKVGNAEEAVQLTETPATDGRTLVKVWSKGGSRFLSVEEPSPQKNS